MSRAEEFLLAFHARFPGASARAYGRGRGADGRSSYEVLADVAPVGGRVLDLGCGDGFLLERLVARGHSPGDLVGVDLSRHELAAARRRPALAAAWLVGADARAMPVASDSVDGVLSHLAFSLMSDVEAVIGEVARVLRPGGVLGAVVGGGPGPGDAFERFLELLAEASADLDVRAPRLGDRRARDAIGLTPLLAAAGFESVAETALIVRLDGTVAEVWASLASAYELAVIPPERVAALRARFAGAVARSADGSVPCSMRVRCVTARRGSRRPGTPPRAP